MRCRPGVWIRHPLILEFEEEAQAELHAFARKALKEAVPVQVKVAVGKPAGGDLAGRV